MPVRRPLVLVNGSIAELPAIDTLPGGSADAWTYVRLTTDFTISTVVGGAVTGLGFSPAINTRYEVEGKLLVRSAATTTGCQPGFAWPSSGVSEGAGCISVQGATVSAQAVGSDTAPNAIWAATLGVPVAAVSYIAVLDAYFIQGATTAGSFQVNLRSEVAASVVTMRAGSFIRFRIVP